MSKRRLIPAALLLAGAACDAEGPPPVDTKDGDLVEIVYRGLPMTAQWQGGVMVIEGDIAVGPADLMSIGDRTVGETDIRVSPLVREPGLNFKWPNGAVRYSVASIAAADLAVVRQGIAMWDQLPGLTFTEVAACTGDCINFVSTTVNNSPAGRQGGTQTINLQSGPPVGTVAHELGHALGAWHEATRSDRGTFVQINWAQVQGCTNAATSFAQCGATPCQMGAGTAAQNAVNNGCCTLAQFNAGQCYRAFNFDIASSSPQALMFAYDYDSLMHYSATAFSKTGATTITALQTLPPGVTMGQRDHVSRSDMMGIQALYPVLRMNTVLFARTGTQPVVKLEGREDDFNERFTCTIGSASATRTIDTATLAEGSFSGSCTAQSVLWAANYGYPNFTSTTWPANGVENFSASATVKVLNAGLISVFVSQI